MARPLKPLIRGGGYYPSKQWTPLVYNGGYTTMDGGEPPTPVYWKTVTGASPITLANALAENISSITQYGKCAQASTPMPSSPVDIKCNNGTLKWDSVNQRIYADGTPEVLSVGGKNLIDPTTRTKPSPNMNRWYNATGFLLKANTAYTFSARSAEKTLNVYIYDFEASTSIKSGSTGTVTYTPTEDKRVFFAAYIANGIPEDTISQLEYGSTATDYEPYREPQTVTNLPNILSVGNFQDKLDIISGIKTGKIGIHIFDGAESFGKSSAYGAAFYIQSAASAWGAQKKEVLCSHFLGLPRKDGAQPDNTCFFNSSGHFYFRVSDNSDTAAFKTWLAAQYAAGTPVIVLFGLATETTEQTAAHSLHTVVGDNTVSVTSNVDPVDLAATYASSEE